MRLILLILLVSCSKPKYALDSQVVYKVPDFYKNVCYGYGRIIMFYTTITGTIVYRIQPPYNERIPKFDKEACPDSLDIQETEVRIRTSILKEDTQYDSL